MSHHTTRLLILALPVLSIVLSVMNHHWAKYHEKIEEQHRLTGWEPSTWRNHLDSTWLLLMSHVAVLVMSTAFGYLIGTLP